MTDTLTPQQLVSQIDPLWQQLRTAIAPVAPPAPPALPVFGATRPTVQLAAPTAYPTARQDRVPLPAPPLPPLPPAGGTFIDPAFNRVILRVTDATPSNGKGWRCPSSEAVAAWGRASDRFFLMRPDGTVELFRMLGGLARLSSSGRAPFTNEPTFSRVRPSVLYGAKGFEVCTYDTDTFMLSLLVDVAFVDPTYAKAGTYLGGSIQSSASEPERVVCFYGGSSQDKHFRVMVFEAQDPTRRLILDTQAKTLNGQALAMDSFLVHAIGLDQSGRYAILYSTSGDIAAGKAQIYVWDLQTATISPITAAMFPYGHTAMGYGTMVNQDNGAAEPYDAFQYQFRHLDTLASPHQVIATPLTPKLVYSDDHPNWTNASADRATPFVTATYRYKFGDTTAIRATDNEIVAVHPTVGVIYRFAHHRSDVFGDGTQRVTFWYQPIPQVSPDGRYILWHSNMEKTLGREPNVTSGPEQSRTDVFLIDTSL